MTKDITDINPGNDFSGRTAWYQEPITLMMLDNVVSIVSNIPGSQTKNCKVKTETVLSY